LDANLIYVRGTIDIKAPVTGDVDYAMSCGLGLFMVISSD
jgi:hypothetical protein